MKWIDGIKLTDKTGLRQACLDRRNLIDQGVYRSLRQLLEIGFFHADPHPGNLMATDDFVWNQYPSSLRCTASIQTFGTGTRASQNFQITAISETDSEPYKKIETSGGGDAMVWKSFDMCAVVAFLFYRMKLSTFKYWMPIRKHPIDPSLRLRFVLYSKSTTYLILAS